MTTKIQWTISDSPRQKYALTSEILEKKFCMECGVLFAHNKNHTKHLKIKKCNTAMTKTIDCYKLICGRYYPVNGDLKDELIGVDKTEQQTTIKYNNKTIHNKMSISQSDEKKLFFMSKFGSMPTNNQNKSLEVDSMLNNLIDEKDKVEDWRPIFHKAIATTCDFIGYMMRNLELYENVDLILKNNVGLTGVFDAFKMLEHNIHGIVYGSRGNIRSSLVKFKLDEGGDVDNPARWGFRTRNEKNDSQCNEFRVFLCFMNHYNCPLLIPYIEKMEKNSYSTENAHKDGLICRLIFELATDNIISGDDLPWVCRFAHTRCFKIKDGNLRLRSIATCGSLFSTLLYILREGALGCAATMEDAGNADDVEQMILHVQKSPPTNILSPWINCCRSKNNKEASLETSLINSKGDIICNNAIFKKEIYTSLLQSMSSKLNELFALAFDGDMWRHFLGEATYKVTAHQFNMPQMKICIIY